MTPNLVAAAIALERQGIDQFAHLIDLDLLRVPRDAQMHVGMRVGAQQAARGAGHSQGRSPADSHNANAVIQFTSCCRAQAGALNSNNECGKRPALNAVRMRCCESLSQGRESALKKSMSAASAVRECAR